MNKAEKQAVQDRLNRIQVEQTEISNAIERLHSEILHLRAQRNKLQQQANEIIFEMVGPSGVK